MLGTGDVVNVAIRSRVYLLVIQYLGNILIPDHDAKVFTYPGRDNATIIDETVHHFLGGLNRWDAQYFLHIAKYGYTHENTVAFFPLYPVILRLIAYVLVYVFPLINLDSALLLASVMLNVVVFILASRILYQITFVLFDKSIAHKSAFLFCYNPASVFFIAPYTECLFSYFTFKSILNCFRLFRTGYNDIFKLRNLYLILPIALSTLVRSNGVLNIGFLVYTYLCIIIKYYSTAQYKISYVLKNLVFLTVCCMICMLPFVLYQIYCYRLFCRDFDIMLPKVVIDYSTANNLVLQGNFSRYNQSWCYRKIPLAYSYAQDHYWNVGLLRYYQFKQLPNFLLASPVLFILLKHSLLHLWHCRRSLHNVFSFKYLIVKKPNKDMYSLELNVFVVHALFLTLFCIFFVHIQVSTRLLCSATPLFYWYCVDDVRNDKSFVKYYFPLYYLLGTVLFCNFLPWT